MKDIFKKIIEQIPAVGLAALSGFARTLCGKASDKSYFWRKNIPEIVIAVFSGLLIHWLTQELGVSDNLRTVAIALAGYSARSVMNVLNVFFATIAKRNPLANKK